jgi:hypothetical protein
MSVLARPPFCLLCTVTAMSLLVGSPLRIEFRIETLSVQRFLARGGFCES